MDTRYYGAGLAKIAAQDLTGPLIVIEGADGVGRSTHMELLQGWLEGHGLAVLSTGLVRSSLTRRGILSAKEGHSFDRTTMARGAARGLNRDWLAKLYGVALIPNRVFFLRLDPEELIRRTLRRGGELEYGESGRDTGLAPDLYSSFRAYQTLILQEFDRMAEAYGFVTIDASRSVEEVQAELRRGVAEFLDPSLLNPPPPDAGD